MAELTQRETQVLHRALSESRLQISEEGILVSLGEAETPSGAQSIEDSSHL